MLSALVLVWRGDRVDLETAGIEGPAKAANEATFAGGIPSLKYEEGPLRGPEISLLDALKRPLEQRQTSFVVGKVHLWVFGDVRKPRAVRDSEILRVYCLRHILPTFAYLPIISRNASVVIGRPQGGEEQRSLGRIDVSRVAIGCPVGSNLTALCWE